MSFRRQGRAVVATLAACALGFTGFSLAVPSGHAAADASNLGVYRGAASPGEVGAFGNWLGQTPGYALDFLASDSWSTIESPNWWLDGWARCPEPAIGSAAASWPTTPR